jgi:pimeloyl-ACP methyl ester carboxylesterase
MTDIFISKHMLTMSGGPACVYELGDAEKPPVLLLHGAMYDEARFIWHHLAPALADERRVLVLDFPRHGLSRPWTGKLGQDALVELVREVAEYFQLAPLLLVGLSMGGSVTMGFTLKYPERVTGAVLMGPGGLGNKVKGQFFSWLYTKIPGALNALVNNYARFTTEMMRKSLIKILETGDASRDLDELTAILCGEARKKKEFGELPMDDWQMEGLAPFRLKLNLLPELHRMACPTLWLRGEKDPLVGQAVMEEAAKLAPGGKLHVIKNAGLLLPLEQPEETYSLVKAFLEDNGL